MSSYKEQRRESWLDKDGSLPDDPTGINANTHLQLGTGWLAKRLAEFWAEFDKLIKLTIEANREKWFADRGLEKTPKANALLEEWIGIKDTWFKSAEQKARLVDIEQESQELRQEQLAGHDVLETPSADELEKALQLAKKTGRSTPELEKRVQEAKEKQREIEQLEKKKSNLAERFQEFESKEPSQLQRDVQKLKEDQLSRRAAEKAARIEEALEAKRRKPIDERKEKEWQDHVASAFKENAARNNAARNDVEFKNESSATLSRYRAA